MTDSDYEQGLDPALLQTALLQVADATKAAADAATAMQQQAQQQTQQQAQAKAAAAPSSGSGSTVDWSKLFQRPPLFEHKSVEDEIKSFRDWSRMLCQYLSAIDSGFEEELKSLFADPTKPLDMRFCRIRFRYP